MTKTNERFWGPALGWGLLLVAVLSFGAFAGEPMTGTCMFILMPYFAALAVVLPVVRTRRFGAATVAYLPYAALGAVPLYIFDYAQSHALKGLWALAIWALSGPLIGVSIDTAWSLSGKLRDGARAALAGAVAQAVTFGVMLLGLTYLYVDPSAADSHLRLFDTSWYFTAPWMIANGAFGGFTAWALSRARSPRAESGGRRLGSDGVPARG